MKIPKLYTTIIQVYSDAYTTETYNINICNSANIKITLKDFNDTPVIDEEVTVYHDGVSIATGTTDNNGEFKTSHKCVQFGLHTISTSLESTTIKVGGWAKYRISRSAENGWSVQLFFNETHAKCVIHDPAKLQSRPVWDEYTTIIQDEDSWLRPNKPVIGIANEGNTMFRISDISAMINRKVIGSQTVTIQPYVQIDWSHRGIPLNYTICPSG